MSKFIIQRAFVHHCLRFSFCVFCSAFPFLLTASPARFSKMEGGSEVPDSERNTAFCKPENLSADEAWVCLYRSADQMLRSYKNVLEFYSKWLSNQFPYQPLIEVYKTKDPWTALQTLEEMAAQKEMLRELGAAEELFDVAQECKDGVTSTPTSIAQKRTFADRILKLVALLVMDNPKQKFPVTDAPCREKVRGSFTRLAEETHELMKDVMTYSDVFLQKAIQDKENPPETHSKDDKDPPQTNTLPPSQSNT